MKEYEVMGELPKGFLGNITYETVLPKEIENLSIHLSFSKREMENSTEEDLLACRRAWAKNSEAEASRQMLEGMVQRQKTEINVSVFHNGAYLGCAHRDETEKEIRLTPWGSSDGFRAWKPSGGILQIVLHVYQVLNERTPYQLTVTGENE